MNKRKLLIGLITCLVLSSFAIAGYLLSVQTTITGHTTSSNSNEILYFTGTFEDFDTLNLTSESGSTNKTIVLTNSNGFLENMNVSIQTQFIGTDPECVIEEGECEILFYLDDFVLNNNGLIDITSGSHELVSSLSCVKRSCPQNVSATITIAE